MDISSIGLGGGFKPLNSIMKSSGLPELGLGDEKSLKDKFGLGEDFNLKDTLGIKDDFKLKGDNLKIVPNQPSFPTNTGHNSFADTLKELVSDVNDMQVEAGNKADMFIKGEPVDLHDVMIAADKAKTSFQLLLELRNKGLDFYREISRMQS